MKYGKVIEGNLKITKENCNDDFSQVVEIKGYCDIYYGVKFNAPQLQTIGGHCNIYSGVKFNAPLAKSGVQEAKQIAMKFTFECFFKLGFVFADNILSKFISKKSDTNGNTIYKVQAIGTSDIEFVIESNGVYSHGDTIKEAKDSLIYKISNRDTSMYEDYTLDTEITFEDAIKMYRCITGACEGGTRNFVENVLKDKKKEYKISEVIELTKGQYNNEILEDFFKRG